MSFKTFKGGIHPNYNKDQTCHVPISVLQPGEEVVIPLKQHIGAPCDPLVQVGDRVLLGQKIGESTSYISAPVHASVSGTVTAIKPHPYPGGGEVMSVYIQNDFKDEKDPSITEWDLELTPRSVMSYIENLEPSFIVDRVKNAGLTGMGGASFPVHVKLLPPNDSKIDYILVNGAECEPYLTSDHRAMLEHPREIVCGALMIAKAVGADKVLLAIENNKPDAIMTMEQICADYPKIEVVKLKTKYPQGSEKQLIQAATGRQVPPGGLPSMIGVVVNNIDTCWAVACAVVTGMPLIQRIVTVSGDTVKKPSNFVARVGMKFHELFDAAEGFVQEPKKIVMGGPMMGTAQTSLDVPVIKGTSGLLAFKAPETFGKEESACIKCGRCVQVCPMRLMPNALSIFSKLKDEEKLKEFNILDCVECGSCAFICPQRRFMVQHIKAGKELLRK